VLAAALAASLAGAVPAGAPAIRLTPVTRLAQPSALAAPPADRSRMFVAERSGRIFVVRNRRRLARPFLDLRGRVRIRSRSFRFDQGGFLSLAFAPDYAASRRLYVLYTDRAERVRIDEVRRSARSADRADAASRRLVLAIPRTANNDVAGHLAFGPDRLLYASFGEGGNEDASQDPGLLQGKLIRIDPRARPYRVPAGNPFTGVAGTRPEIWASGFRVPWSFSFDRRTGDLSVADVGQTSVEEVDHLPRRAGLGRGANFGWPFVEGDMRRRPGGTGLVAPVLTREHGRRTCAIVGGHVMRDPRLPGLAGRYLYGDFCTGELRSARLRLPRAAGDRRERPSLIGLDALATDARGRTWATSILGNVVRLDPR
jgi:glucose/arabinose dehydrogenase